MKSAEENQTSDATNALTTRVVDDEMKEYLKLTLPRQDIQSHPSPGKIGKETLGFWRVLYPHAPPPSATDRSSFVKFWLMAPTDWPSFFLHALLAQESLCPMAGSAPSERLFSEAGDVLTKDRSRLDADLVEDLVF